MLVVREDLVNTLIRGYCVSSSINEMICPEMILTSNNSQFYFSAKHGCLMRLQEKQFLVIFIRTTNDVKVGAK